METINPTFSYLTNLEVMQILQKIKTTKKKFGMRNLATVTYEALQYLEETPCKTQTRDSIVNYVKDLSSYRLKSHEILQMVNDPPTSALHTQLLIDDNKAPLTDEQNEKIIQLSYKHFHGSEGKETKDGHAEPTARQMPAKSTSKSAPPSKAPEPEAAAIVPDAEAESPPLTEASPAEESNPEAEATQTEAEALNPTEEDANPATAAESKEPGDQPKE